MSDGTGRGIKGEPMYRSNSPEQEVEISIGYATDERRRECKQIADVMLMVQHACSREVLLNAALAVFGSVARQSGITVKDAMEAVRFYYSINES